MTTTIAPRFAPVCKACRFIGYLSDSDVFECKGSVLIVHSDEPGDYSSMALAIAAQQPAEYDIAQAAKMVLDAARKAATPADGTSRMTSTQRSSEMNEQRLVKKVTTVETYVEFVPNGKPVTRTVTETRQEPVETTAQPTTVTGPGPREGDRVWYTSRRGTRYEYRVLWVGVKDGRLRVGLRPPYVKDPKNEKGFFVWADECEFIRRGR